MKELSPAARAVLKATAVKACLAEWGTVNDPPCHPDDEGWNGCHLCVKRDLVVAALRAAVDQAIPMTKTPWGTTLVPVLSAEESRKRILAIAAELTTQKKADYQATGGAVSP